MERIDTKTAVKQEASMPVQSRIDIRSLAEMDVYWTGKGVYIKSLSQLVAWTVDLCRDVLNNNGLLTVKMDRIKDARDHMVGRGLTQKSMEKRGKSKMRMARGFDEIRVEGGEPAVSNPLVYKNMHQKNNTVEVYDEGDGDRVVDESMNERVARLQKIAMENLKPEHEDTFIPEVDALLGKTDEVFERPDGVVDDEYLEKERQKANEQKVNDMTAKSSHTPSDRPRSKSNAEMDVEAVRLKKKDADYAEQLKNM